MHAIALRRLRPVYKCPARLVAGRRHPRRFHAKTSCLLPKRLPGAVDRPCDPYDAAEPALDHAVPEEVTKPSDETIQTAASAQEDAQGQGGQNEGPRRIVEAPRARTERGERPGTRPDKLPPVIIPEWFQKRNIKLAEEELGSKPRASYSCTINVRNVFGERLLATISVPITEGDGLRAYEDIKIQTTPEDAESEAAEAEAAPKDIGWSPDFWIQAEIQAAISSSLSIARPGHLPFPAARSNLLLHCPADGGIAFLTNMVKETASSVGADVIQLGAQDIAEIGADYLGDDLDPSYQSIRTLGFETHQSPPIDDAEESFEDASDEDPHGTPSMQTVHTATLGTPAITLSNLRKTSGLLRDILRGLRGRKANSMPLQGPTGPPPGSTFRIFGMTGSVGEDSEGYGVPKLKNVRKEDTRLRFLLAALAESNEFKRAKQDGSSKTTDKQWNFFTGATPTQSKELDLSDFIGTLGAARSSEFILAPQRQRPDSVVGEVTDRKTILLVQDFKEMMNTSIGRSVLTKLAEIVMERRRYGQAVAIVGVTSAADLVPDLSAKGMRALQNEHQEGPYRTILVPPGYATTESDTDEGEAHAKDLKNAQESYSELDATEDAEEIDAADEDLWLKSDRERVEEINQRHILDMLKRIDPSVTEGTQNMDWEKFMKSLNSVNRGELGRRALSHEETHRLCFVALGLRPTRYVTPEALAQQINLAMTIIQQSDSAKFAWCAVQQQLEKNADVVSTSADEKLESIKSSCNDHERRLIGGLIHRQKIRTTFADVHAPAESIESLKTLTSLSLTRPDAFKYGVLATDKISGLLLYGPPGTGKTLLAKAVARESGAAVLEVSGSEVNDMYVGESEKNVKAIFTLARKLSPCVVFIDEADALFRSRSGQGSRTAHREVINQFLREWDGMDDQTVFIMVATNRPFDLDDAVLRRLPRRLLVDLPTEGDRESILRIHLKDEILDSDVSLSELASRTPFYSGSDLKNVSVAAALACVREENEQAASHIKELGIAADAYQYPQKRRLSAKHFEQAIQEISASISEDMSSLVAIKKFDEQYGDRRGRRKKKVGWGFMPVGGMGEAREELARVRI